MSFKKGDVVCVYSQKMSGEPILEGRAKVIKSSGVRDQYIVRFENGERATRFVYGGECQTDPSGHIKKAQDEWRRQHRAALRRDAEKLDRELGGIFWR